MIFNTFAYYFIFLIPAAILFRVVSNELRPWVCVFSGIGFYVHFSLTAVGGWAGAVCVGLFLWEAAFSRLYQPGKRICLVGIGASLAILTTFKYWNFFIDTLSMIWQEGEQYRWANAFLPLGVSFFTFEFIHYAVDRYRCKADAGTIGEYLAFIFFFPTMVAGPIKRFQDFLPCLQNPSQDWATDWNRGLTRIFTGLVKKFAFADLLTSLTDHLNATDINQAQRSVLIFWLFAYGWKIYFDFSAYSDIAIGSGRLFGIRIPENFDWPYFRTNIAEFWRHWHISLYLWLRDYVFIPLGGSRYSSASVYRNVMLVMLVSGIWHGAGWNFVVWGLWHGCLLAVHRAYSMVRAESHPTLLKQLVGWAFTYISVNFGWAFFAMDIETAILFFQRLIFQ